MDYNQMLQIFHEWFMQESPGQKPDWFGFNRPSSNKKIIDFIGNYFFKYFTTDGQKRDCLVVIN